MSSSSPFPPSSPFYVQGLPMPGTLRSAEGLTKTTSEVTANIERLIKEAHQAGQMELPLETWMNRVNDIRYLLDRPPTDLLRTIEIAVEYLDELRNEIYSYLR